MINGAFPSVTKELQAKFEKYVAQSVQHVNELKKISQFQQKWWHHIPIVNYFAPTKPTISKNAQKLEEKLTKVDQASALQHFENVLRELTSKKFIDNLHLMSESNQVKLEDYKRLIDIAHEINQLKKDCLIEEKIYLLNELGTLDIAQIHDAFTKVKEGIEIRIQAEMLIDEYTHQMVNAANKNTNFKFSPQALDKALKELATQNPSLFEKYKKLLDKVEQINQNKEELKTLSLDVQEIYRLKKQAIVLEAKLKDAGFNELLNIAQDNQILTDAKALATQDPNSFNNLYGTILCLSDLQVLSQDVLESEQGNILSAVRTMNPDITRSALLQVKSAVEERKQAQLTLQQCFEGLKEATSLEIYFSHITTNVRKAIRLLNHKLNEILELEDNLFLVNEASLPNESEFLLKSLKKGDVTELQDAIKYIGSAIEKRNDLKMTVNRYLRLLAADTNLDNQLSILRTDEFIGSLKELISIYPEEQYGAFLKAAESADEIERLSRSMLPSEKLQMTYAIQQIKSASNVVSKLQQISSNITERAKAVKALSKVEAFCQSQDSSLDKIIEKLLNKELQSSIDLLCSSYPDNEKYLNASKMLILTQQISSILPLMTKSESTHLLSAFRPFDAKNLAKMINQVNKQIQLRTDALKENMNVLKYVQNPFNKSISLNASRYIDYLVPVTENDIHFRFERYQTPKMQDTPHIVNEALKQSPTVIPLQNIRRSKQKSEELNKVKSSDKTVKEPTKKNALK